MKPSLKTRSMLLAAVATLALSGVASAQYQIDNSRALDANRRVGSAGWNDRQMMIYDSSNLIITGDVTGGRQFRGSLGYTDSRAFRGTLPSSTFDSFVRSSSGITTGGQSSFNAQVVRPYFGVGRGVNPVRQDLRMDLGGGYVPATPRQFDPADGRIDYGGLDTAQVVSGLSTTPNAATLPGASARYEMLSSTARMRDANRLDPNNASFLSEYTSLLRPSTLNPVDQETLNKLREANTRRPNEESTTDANGSVDLNAPLGGPIDQRLNTQPTDAESLETGAAISSRSIGLKAGKNTTLDQLREQQLKFNEQRKSQVQLPGSEAAEKIRANNEAIRKAAEDAESEDGNFDKGTPKLPPTRTPEDVKPQDDAPVISNPDRNATEAPDQAAPEVEVKAREKINFVEVDSFSKGVADAPLSAIVQNAESLMQRQRFASAIVEFDKAEGISPDDPMVQMGRSVAELGGGYYRRAEIYLRRSIEKDPAVLLGRYNLRGMLTDVRLDVILKDLKKVAAENPQDAGPLMLLGYVYFNSGAEVRGYEYIQRARQIAGEDPALDAMLEAWKIEQQ